MIQNRDHFRKFMKDYVEIDEYISIMMPDDKRGGHTELVALSELYNAQNQIFNSLELWESISRISIVKEVIHLCAKN